MAFRYAAFDRGFVSPTERDSAFWLQFEPARLVGGDDGVGCPAVHKEPDGRLLSGRAGGQPFNIGKAHATLSAKTSIESAPDGDRLRHSRIQEHFVSLFWIDLY